MIFKIVIINDFAHINGGAGQVALSSAVALAEQGYSITLFCAVAPIMEELQHRNLRIICTKQHEILRDPNRFRAAVQGIWNFKAARVMAALLGTLDSSRTVIHLHSWTKALSSSIVKVALGRGFKVICTMHDYFLACPNGGFFNYPENSICQLSPLSIKCITKNCDVRSYPQKLWRVSRQMVQENLGRMPKGINDFIAVSAFSKAILEPFLPKNARVNVVANPIDVPKSESVNISENNAFVFIGRLSREKGAVLFARAAAMLGLQAVFVGDGPLRDEILNIYPSAIITGWLPRIEVNNLINTARALVFPSVWYETLGLVVLEAAARGVPAIVSDTSAARDIVMDKETGLWFKGGDLDDLINKIGVFQDGVAARKMGQMAYQRYWGNPCTMEKHLEKLINVYRMILQ